MWLDRRSSSSSTSSFCSHITSSCSARPGSTGCGRSARRAASLARWPSRMAGISVRTSAAMRSMASTRSAIAVASVVPSRSRAAMKPSSTWSSSANASTCRAAASVASPWVTPGSCSRSVKLTCRLGKSEVSRCASWPSWPSSTSLICRLAAESGARRRITRSSLPRLRRAEMRSRSCGSNARSSSGRRVPTSRNRWLTERSSQPSVPHVVERSPPA
ncbi:hypothetical protein D3C73_1110250 [compost metagenome]